MILSTIASFLQLKTIKDSISYLDEKLPEIKFKENVLSLENESEAILDDEKIIANFGCSIVINTSLEKQEAIDKYKEKALQNNVIIFLKDEYVLILKNYNSESENEEAIINQNYSDISSKFIKDMSYEYGKNDVLEYLSQRSSFSYYLAQYFVIYFVTITFIYILYIALISAGVWLVTKAYKSKWTYKEALTNTIYASTLSMFVYVLYTIISYFTKFRISFMDIISIALIFVYIYLILWKQKRRKV